MHSRRRQARLEFTEIDPGYCYRQIGALKSANAPCISIERGRLAVVLMTVAINVVAVSLLAFAPWSDWRTGAELNLIDNFLLVGYAPVRRDALLGRFVLFGVVVGVVELPAEQGNGHDQESIIERHNERLAAHD